MKILSLFLNTKVFKPTFLIKIDTKFLQKRKIINFEFSR